MTLKINPILLVAILIGLLVLILAFVNGCNKKKQIAEENKSLKENNTALIKANKDIKSYSDSMNQLTHDSLEFERGQTQLIIAQKGRTELLLDASNKTVTDLLEKHKLAQYTDTTSMVVPAEYVTDCEGCYVQLQSQNSLVNRYKKDVSLLGERYEKQERIYINRFNDMQAQSERAYFKIDSLTKVQSKSISKVDPHGRLYLSWGVMWGPLPKMAGAGLLYQSKNNMIYGAKCYYGANGYLIETTMNFPLSLRFK